LNRDCILLQLFVEVWSTSHTTTFVFTLLLFLHSCLCYGFVNTNVPLPNSVLWVTVCNLAICLIQVTGHHCKLILFVYWSNNASWFNSKKNLDPKIGRLLFRNLARREIVELKKICFFKWAVFFKLWMKRSW
jgi:hypothetical protein